MPVFWGLDTNSVEEPKSEFRCPFDEDPRIPDELDSVIADACPINDVVVVAAAVIGARVD